MKRTDESGVPQIVLIDDKGEHRGLQGSYCWDGICVDYAMPSKRVDFKEKLFIQKDATVAFKTTHPIGPGQLYVTIFSGDKIVLHQAVDKQIKVEIPTGTYFLNVKASWNGQGDASNVFFIEVL